MSEYCRNYGFLCSDSANCGLLVNQLVTNSLNQSVSQLRSLPECLLFSSIFISSYIHSFISSIIHSHIPSCMHVFIRVFVSHSFILSFVHYFICSFIFHSFTCSFIHLFDHSLTFHSSMYSWANFFTHLLFYSLIRSFLTCSLIICSFIH